MPADSARFPDAFVMTTVGTTITLEQAPALIGFAGGLRGVL
jgi:hypothetical protein